MERAKTIPHSFLFNRLKYIQNKSWKCGTSKTGQQCKLSLIVPKRAVPCLRLQSVYSVSNSIDYSYSCNIFIDNFLMLRRMDQSMVLLCQQLLGMYRLDKRLCA
jgi:hypothetical protein